MTSRFHPDSLPDLTGKVFIVTGGNSGIGYYTVAHLAAHGAHVYLCSRSAEKGNAAIESIKALHSISTNQTPLTVSLLEMDLTDLSTVVAATERFLSLETRLDGLVNNAGVLATPFEITNDGHEAQWQTNYLAHWLLTTRLLPLMLRTSIDLPAGSVRIVNLTSSGHLTAPKCGIDLDDPSLRDSGTPWTRYGQSKLANILHAKTLHRLYGPGSPSARAGEGEIWTTAVHPGPVETNISLAAQGGGMEMRVLAVYRFLGLVWGADKGSWNTLFCAASGDMKAEQSGGYIDIYRRCGELWWQSAKARDLELAERLEQWTAETMAREGWLT
ncbi:putative dehydrogenase [Naviculisporaceae sp. PSN 640]